jgi:hypothetical protein
MADNTVLDAGAGGDTIATDDIAGVKHQRVKIEYGVDGSATDVSDTNPLPVDDAGGSLTVDNAALAVTGGGVEATALRVTLASDSTGVVSVDDNGATLSVDDGGGSLTVDVGSVAAGDNNIGNVDIVTLPTAVADGGALPAVVEVVGGYDGANAQVLKTDNTGVLQVDIEAALPAGANAIGKLAANSGVDIGDVDVTSIAAGTNTIGDVGLKPRTSGGYSIATDIDLDETETEIKATAGQLFGWFIYNDGAAEVYVKLYNATAANVVVGTTVPVMTLGIPAGSAANVFTEVGIAFSTAICAAATTVATTADTTAPAANQVVANFFFA